MSDSNGPETDPYHYHEVPISETDLQAPVRSRVLLSSTMMSAEMVLAASGSSPRSDGHLQSEQPQPTGSAEPRDIGVNGPSSISTSITTVPELAALKKFPQEQRENNKETALIASPKKSLTDFKSSTTIVSSILSKKVGALTKEAAKMKNLNLMEAVQVVANYIPVVGGNSSNLRASRVRLTRQPMDTVDADELADSPLHKACALSATTSLSSSTSIQGGDLATIKRLVAEDPSRLHYQLPSSGDSPLHIAIKFGAMQWLQIQDFPGGGGTSNLAVVEYLIKADIDYLRREAVKKQKAAGTSAPIALGSLISKTALYKRDFCGKELPLHSAVVEGYEGAVRVLLNADKDADYDTILARDVNSNLPLHLAVHGDDITLVKLLLEADAKREEIHMKRRQTVGRLRREPKRFPSVIAPNDAENIPLHLSLSSVHKFEMWRLLLDADETKETLHAKNREGVTPFRFFVDRPLLCKDEEEFVDTHLAEAILDRLLSGKRLEPWDDHLKRSVAKSKRMQVAMNEAAANRLPVVIFIADLYSHIISAAILWEGTQNYLLTDGARELPWMGETLFVLCAYYLMRELVQLYLTRDLYWADFWNYTDIVRIGLLFVLALIIHGSYYDPYDKEDSDEYLVRRMLLAMAVFVYMGLVSFLRITYLPFALFVGGTGAIVSTLIPFMVTFILMLALFAYGWWVGGFKSTYTGEEQSYLQWFYEIFLSALNGPESLATMEPAYIHNAAWTVLFMLLVQIFMLNVLIAVVTSAWDKVTEKQTTVFWQYRLEYAAGVLPIEYFFRRYLGSTCVYRWIAKLGGFIDSLDDKGYRDHVNWDLYPYSLVMDDSSLYWESNQFVQMVSEEVKKQQRSHRPPMLDDSLSPRSHKRQEEVLAEQQSKALKKWKQMRSFESDMKFSRSFFERVCTRLRVILFFVLYVFFFFLGFITFGFWWPRRVRSLFCAGALTSDEEDDIEEKDFSASAISLQRADADTASQERFDSLENKVDDMKQTIESLQRTIEQLVKLQQSAKTPQPSSEE
ncbi:expressed unknown protein [Seminavis robusta]|uniref:Ion transport domain-containing protein n=1 Tax=Seminavis robusta TaxID=568900 RepID=A0A9N8EAT3_9STRA|nr:expressed unknown protein [Seminavis robusta]|eukprot:Sro855_g211370.1 n/a (1023) ;mRNA; f:13733-17054